MIMPMIMVMITAMVIYSLDEFCFSFWQRMIGFNLKYGVDKDSWAEKLHVISNCVCTDKPGDYEVKASKNIYLTVKIHMCLLVLLELRTMLSNHLQEGGNEIWAATNIVFYTFSFISGSIWDGESFLS